jgi:hypothetical protein
VQLVRCNDPYTRLTPGEQGTVGFIDSLGTVSVKWDSGSSLGLVREDGDAWTVLPKPKPARVSKARALVESGLADNLADARAQLEDMGELS